MSSRARQSFALPSASRPRGFTLIELLTVVAILGILAAILIPTVASCRRQADKSREVSAARQLMVGFHLAADENRGVFISQNHNSGTVNEQGQSVSMHAASTRWPHRLRPYLGDRFKATLYVNAQADYYDRVAADQSGALRDYHLSLGTTFGMNGWFVGSTAAVNLTDAPVKTLAQAALPSRLIAFTSANGRNGAPPTLDMGYFKIEPPSAGWPAADLFAPPDPALDAAYGYVAYRHGGKTVTAFLDGHVELLSCADLRDMRLWSDQARRQDNPNYAPAY